MKMGVIKFAYGIILALAGISFAIDDPVVNAAPALANDGADHYDVEENSIRGLVVAKFVVENVNSKNGLVLELESTDGLDVYVANLFDTEVYEIQDTVYAVITVKAAPDYESMPHAYGVMLTLKDDGGSTGGNQDTVIRTINLVDVNEAPQFEITDQIFDIEENCMNGDSLGTLSVSDPDMFNVARFGHLEYEILDKSTPFAMDSNRIVVADSALLNYEKLTPNTVFRFDVQVANCLRDAMTGKFSVSCRYDTLLVTVFVKDSYDPPRILVDVDDDGLDDVDDKCIENCDTTNRGSGNLRGDNILVIGVDKNASGETAVFEYVVTDEDDGQVSDLTATLTDVYALGTDTLFNVRKIKHGDVWTVGVYVAKTGCLKSENLFRDYTLKVTVRDSDGKKDEIRRVVRLLNVAEKSSSSIASSSSAKSSSSVASSSSVRSSSSIVRSSSSVASSSSIRSSSSMVRLSSSSLARYSSSSRNGISSSSRDEIRLSSTFYMELSSSSSSRMDWSSSSVLEIILSSSSSCNDEVALSSSSNEIGSSSSRGFFIRVSSSSEIFIDPRERRSSSSTEYFGDVFAEPSFRVKFQGPFQIVIVMDAPIASVTNRNFAVMDLQGRVLRQGTVYTTETIVQGLGKGSYVVKVGLGVRRVNIQ